MNVLISNTSVSLIPYVFYYTEQAVSTSIKIKSKSSRNFYSNQQFLLNCNVLRQFGQFFNSQVFPSFDFLIFSNKTWNIVTGAPDYRSFIFIRNILFRFFHHCRLFRPLDLFQLHQIIVEVFFHSSSKSSLAIFKIYQKLRKFSKILCCHFVTRLLTTVSQTLVNNAPFLTTVAIY